MDSIDVRCTLSKHLLDGQLVVVSDQLPAIAEVLALTMAKDNLVKFLTISLKYGASTELAR